MSDYSPITPPPELVQQWASEWMQLQNVNRDNFMATRAAQWGAHQELEACCEQLADRDWYDGIKNLRNQFRAAELRAARRPKPSSLKEQAHDAYWALRHNPNEDQDANQNWDTIRRALEQLND